MYYTIILYDLFVMADEERRKFASQFCNLYTCTYYCDNYLLSFSLAFFLASFSPHVLGCVPLVSGMGGLPLSAQNWLLLLHKYIHVHVHVCMMHTCTFTKHAVLLLTLGMHVQQGLQQLSCVSVCLSVTLILAQQAIRRPVPVVHD